MGIPGAGPGAGASVCAASGAMGTAGTDILIGPERRSCGAKNEVLADSVGASSQVKLWIASKP